MWMIAPLVASPRSRRSTTKPDDGGSLDSASAAEGRLLGGGEGRAQREDLRVLVLVAHRQQLQQGEHVRHTQIGKSKQHDRSSCGGTHQVPRAPAQAPALDTTRTPAPTRTDEVIGRHRAARERCTVVGPPERDQARIGRSLQPLPRSP